MKLAGAITTLMLALSTTGCLYTAAYRDARAADHHRGFSAALENSQREAGDHDYTNVESVGVLVDVAIFQDSIVSADYVSDAHSQVAASHVSDAAVECLTAKGFDVEFVDRPYVGGYLASETPIYFEAADVEEVEKIAPPIGVGERVGIEADRAYRLLSLKLMETMASPPADRVLQLDDRELAELQRISGTTGVKGLLVVQMMGKRVPIAKSLAQAAFTSAITAVASAGALWVMAHNVTFSDSFVSLVDLERGALVYSSSLRIKSADPTREKTYAQWKQWLFYHLPFLTLADPTSPCVSTRRG